MECYQSFNSDSKAIFKKTTFKTEQEAIEYKSTHPSNMVVEQFFSGKWGVVFDIPCFIEVRQPHRNEK